HLRRNGALPTGSEEAALIQRYIDNEVLYREALALGLDRGDIIVRRRLVQKMEFLTEGLDPLPEPTDAELQAYLDAHAERYVVGAAPVELRGARGSGGCPRPGLPSRLGRGAYRREPRLARRAPRGRRPRRAGAAAPTLRHPHRRAGRERSSLRGAATGHAA